MPNYKEMYNKLCHAQAKLDYLFEEARAIIREAQQETERMYLESKDPVILPPPACTPAEDNDISCKNRKGGR